MLISRVCVSRLQLWDIAGLLVLLIVVFFSVARNNQSNESGQERFGHMTRVYYKEVLTNNKQIKPVVGCAFFCVIICRRCFQAVGAMVVFDVTRSGTFEAVQKWKVDLDNNLSTPERKVNLSFEDRKKKEERK